MDRRYPVEFSTAMSASVATLVISCAALGAGMVLPAMRRPRSETFNPDRAGRPIASGSVAQNICAVDERLRLPHAQ
jgi:hypothetical protein